MSKNRVAELKNLRHGKVEEAQKALEGGDNAAYEAAMAEVKKYNGEIEAVENLLAEQGRFDDGDGRMAGLNAGISQKKEERRAANEKETVLASSEYRNAFIKALENKIDFVDGNKRITEETAVLYNALSGIVEEDGGYLVPVDVSNRIIELKRAFTNLEQFVNVENTNVPTGTRVFEKGKAKNVFMTVAESEAIGEIESPKFRQIRYAVDKYGGHMRVPNELLNDNAANLMEYIARWIARYDINTNNKEIKKKLDTLTAKPLVNINDLKQVFNVELDPDISINSIVLTNQSGYNYLDQLEDAMGRGLLQPDLTSKTGNLALGRRVIMLSNNVLPDTNGKAPLYIGWFEEFLTKFNRMGYEMAMTNVGAGAFLTWTTVFRALSRFDYQIFDDEAVVKREVTL